MGEAINQTEIESIQVARGLRQTATLSTLASKVSHSPATKRLSSAHPLFEKSDFNRARRTWIDLISVWSTASHFFLVVKSQSDTERFFFQLNRCWAKNDQIFNTLLYIINLKPFSKLSFAKFEALKSRAFTRETSISNQMESG